MSTNPAAPSTAEAARPWWRYPIVWLVVSGPAAVVVAGIATAVIAVGGADPVVQAGRHDASARPALQVRNHAATLAAQPAEP